MEEFKQKILTPLVKLDTPDKAAVEVVILADPVSDYFVSLFLISCCNLNTHVFFKHFINIIFSIKKLLLCRTTMRYVLLVMKLFENYRGLIWMQM